MEKRRKREYLNKNHIIGIVMLVLTILWVCFIFGNSLDVPEVSSKKSGEIAGWFTGIITEHIIRKLAHLIEYTILGVLLALDVYFLKVINKIELIKILFSGFIIASIDELIQLTVEGRSSQFSDVCIDFLGVVLGTVAIILLMKGRGKCIATCPSESK